MAFPGLYTEFFELDERPFTLLPDPDFLFWSNTHKSAFTVLQYGMVTRAPITVITGEVGTGKTTLVQALLHSTDDEMTVGLISNAQGGRGELLQWALNAFGVQIKPDEDYVSMFQRMQDFLLEEYTAGRHVVLIVDEAQNLSVEALEELRLLTNINANKDELIQLVLVGQPELRQKIMRPELRQFAQRVVATFHLSAMSQEMTGEYIKHRLQHAGGTGEEISGDAVSVIYEATMGIPRLVNKLCDFSMIYAASSNNKIVTRDHVQRVMDDELYSVALHQASEAAE